MHGRPNAGTLLLEITGAARCPWRFPKQVSAAQQVMALNSDAYSKALGRCLFGVFCQRLGASCQSIKPPLPDDVPLKDELAPWMALLIGRAQ